MNKLRESGSNSDPSTGRSVRLVKATSAGLLVVFGLGMFGPSNCGRVSTVFRDTPSSAATQKRVAERNEYQVLNTFPHDPKAYLQGLLWHDGSFYESTGQYGQSSLRRVEFPSGKVVQLVRLSPDLFGEGLARVDNRLIQLTWKSGRGLVYDLKTLRLLDEFTYQGEGWGLTFDGKYLIMSNGSDSLTYLDAHSYKPLRKLQVTMNGAPVRELNELEFIEGEIWANVWHADLIVRIAPSSGEVVSFLDLKGILKPELRTDAEAVLNGIAYDPQRKRIFVTGKLWPLIFEIKLK